MLDTMRPSLIALTAILLVCGCGRYRFELLDRDRSDATTGVGGTTNGDGSASGGGFGGLAAAGASSGGASSAGAAGLGGSDGTLVEICNGVDDDLDGMADEGCGCGTGETDLGSAASLVDGPAVAATGTGYALLWAESDDDSYFAEVDLAGNVLTAATSVSATGDVDTRRYSLFRTSDGYMAAWQARVNLSRTVRVASLDAQGSVTAGPLDPLASEEVSASHLLSNPTGTGALVWLPSTGQRLYFATLDAGLTVGARQMINDGHARPFPGRPIHVQDKYWIPWVDGHGVSPDIVSHLHVALVSSAGEVERTVDLASDVWPNPPGIANAGGSVVFSWLSSDRSMLRYAALDATGEFTAGPLDVLPLTAGLMSPAVAATSDRVLVAVWDDTELLTVELSPTGTVLRGPTTHRTLSGPSYGAGMPTLLATEQSWALADTFFDSTLPLKARVMLGCFGSN